MQIDKEFVTTLIAIVGATAAIMSKMATKDSVKDLDVKFTKRIDDLDIKLSAKIDRVTEIKADKDDVNQRLISIETYLRLPIAPKQETPR